MRIGLFYQMQVPKPWSADSESKRFWEMLEEVTYAEEIGMESVWFVEHHFRAEWSHSSAPDLSLAAISQRTSKIRLGLAVALPPLHHPLHMAVRLATLDILSKGRLDLGVGRTSYPYQMTPYGVDLKDATGILEETLRILPKAWTEEEFSFEGEHFHIPPREIVPKPVQKPHPPIWQACTQEETYRKAGELGLGCLAQTSVGAERSEPLIRIYREAAQNAQPVCQRITNQVTGNTMALCMENRQKAMERGAELIDWYRQQQRIRDAKVWQGYDPAKVPEDYRWHYNRRMNDTARRDDSTSLDLIRRGGRYAIGNPDDCINYLEQYEAIGVDEIMPLFQLGPVTHEEVMESLRLFGKHIIPHFKEKAKRQQAALAANN